MTPSSTVIASVVIITSTTILRRTREGKAPSGYIIETIIFGFLLLVALLILAIVMPQIAKVLGYLGMVGAFVVNGPEVFKLLGNFGRSNGVASTSTRVVNQASQSGSRSLAGLAR